MDIMQNLGQLPKEQLLDYIEMQFKNLWTLQNNYIVRLEGGTVVEFFRWAEK